MIGMEFIDLEYRTITYIIHKVIYLKICIKCNVSFFSDLILNLIPNLT